MLNLKNWPWAKKKSESHDDGCREPLDSMQVHIGNKTKFKAQQETRWWQIQFFSAKFYVTT